ncbi:hypothetical protein [Alloactinosynnema sp. L-07]|uniref:hypothetical protein n=1 Tax=Alloactinosynnema sp. L-07 TaxID=1653480 RepID=UPI0015613FE0
MTTMARPASEHAAPSREIRAASLLNRRYGQDAGYKQIFRATTRSAPRTAA